MNLAATAALQRIDPNTDPLDVTWGHSLCGPLGFRAKTEQYLDIGGMRVAPRLSGLAKEDFEIRHIDLTYQRVKLLHYRLHYKFTM